MFAHTCPTLFSILPHTNPRPACARARQDDKPVPLHPPPCVYETVNPKAVSGDELYGYMTLSKDWRDGVLSIIMRGMSKNYADQVHIHVL